MAAAKGAGPPPKATKVDTDELLRKWESDKKSRVFLQLAEEYRKRDQVDAALGVLREGLKHHAAFQPAHVALGRCLLAKGQLAEAQAELEPVYKKSPDNLLAGKVLAEVLEARGERRRALVILEALLPLSIDDPEVAHRIAALRQAGGPTVATGEATDTAELAAATSHPAPPAPPAPPPPRVAPPAASSAPVRTTFPVAEQSDPFGDLDDDLESETTANDLADTIGGDAPLPPSRVASAPSPPAPVGDDDAPFDLGEVDLADGESTLTAARPPVPKPSEGPGELLGASRAMATEPDEDDFASLTLAELYESQGAHDEAAAIYERLLARKPGDGSLRKALERCRARKTGADVASSVVEAVGAPAPTVARPRWEPVRARQAPAQPEVSPPPRPAELAAKPVPDAVVAPRPALRTRQSAVPTPRAGQGRRAVRELRRWLAAVAAVRQ